MQRLSWGIPPPVPSQSCCARQLPQRGSQGNILATTNLSTHLFYRPVFYRMNLNSFLTDFEQTVNLKKKKNVVDYTVFS